MRRKMLPMIWALVFALILLPIDDRSCLAETENPTYATSYEYLVTSGDVLEIAVWGHKDLSGTVTVNQDGNISLAGLPEEIHVVGMTVSEVQASLTDMLTYYLRNPIVSVTLRETRMIRITVIGSVRSPGVYSFRSKPSLIGALASAGGYISDADLTRVRITGMGTMASTSNTRSESIIVDIDKLLAGEKEIESEYGFVLSDGDIVYVPERATTVSVLGEVQRPGVYTVDTKVEGTSLFDIIAAAGGPGVNADTGCIRVTRNKGQTACTIEIDLDTHDSTFKLVPGDTIYVPRAIRVQVLGQVKNPGSYQLKAKSTLIHAIAQAGGTLDSADTACISLHRAGGAESGVFVFDLELALSGKLPSEDLILQDQDTIIIPELVREVSVLGAVNRPGVYRIHKNARILQVLAQTGGISEDGDGASAVLTRRLQSGETEHLKINLEELQSAAGEEDNLPVHSGDIIYVPRAVTVMVLGKVKGPGTYALGSTGRLMDALSRAGGILPDGDQTNVTLTRNGSGSREVREFDIRAIMAGASDLNISLLDGDIIFVPDLVREVSVMGEVARPGVYRMKAGSRLSDAVAIAGGLKDDADGERVVITSRSPSADVAQASTGYDTLVPKDTSAYANDAVRTVDINRVLMGSNLSDNIYLLDQDTIFVPKLSREVVIVGEVARPGLYRLPRGAKLMDALAVAGGPTKRAALEAVCIFREGRVTDGRQVILGHDNLFFTGKAEDNPSIEGQDIVYVPSTTKLEWDRVFSFLSGLKLIRDLILR